MFFARSRSGLPRAPILAAWAALSSCAENSEILELPEDVDWVALVGPKRATGLHPREDRSLSLDGDGLVLIGYSSADLGATPEDAEALSDPLERSTEACDALPPPRYAVAVETRLPRDPPPLKSRWSDGRCRRLTEGLALESSCASAPFAARVAQAECELSFDLELPWAARLERARIKSDGRLCVPAGQGCLGTPSTLEMSCEYEMESCQLWVREPEPLFLVHSRVELAPPSFPPTFDWKTPDTVASGALIDLELAGDDVAVLVREPTETTVAWVARADLSVRRQHGFGAAQRIAIDPRDSDLVFAASVTGSTLVTRAFGAGRVRTASVGLTIQEGFRPLVADMIFVDEGEPTLLILVHYTVETSAVRVAPLGDRLVSLSADDLSVRLISSLERLGPTRLMEGPPSGRGLYLSDDINDSTYSLGPLGDLKPTIGLADVEAIDWQGFGSSRLFTIGSLGHSGALFVGDSLVMSLVGDVTAAIALREGEVTSLAPVYSVIANPDALTVWPAQPNRVLVGMRDREAPTAKARVGLFDLSTRHVRPETLEVGRGAVTEAVTDEAGNAWLLLSWEGVLVRVSPAKG
ncbi:MAG: hypothetical protein HY791_35945 [Deltaproteobacteria bacterium]|nr:hypothetical protein [Deltaproteobacteria bacterium]